MESGEVPAPTALCGLLAEPDRLAVYAAVVLGADTVDRISATAGLSPARATQALRRLERGGLVWAGAAGWAAGAAPFKAAVRRARPASPPEPPLDPDPDKAAVLRAFLRAGRLVRVPAARGKRRIVLEHLAAAFEPGVRYPEREVDAVLRAWHDDHATLRRYLVDEGLMAREAAVYWRCGGPVPIG